MDTLNKILGLKNTWAPPKFYTEMEKLAGIGREIASRQEKIAAMSGLLTGNRIPAFSPHQQDHWKAMLGIATQANKLHKTLLDSVQQSPLFKMNTQLMGLDRTVAGVALPKEGFHHYTPSMQAILGNTQKMHAALHKMIGQSPAGQLAREFKGYKNLGGKLRTAALSSLPPLLVEELNQQAEQAVVLAESFVQPQNDINTKLNKFREFIDESFTRINDNIRKTARSPKAEIDFWAGIISLLITLMVLILQAAPATERQVNAVDQKLDKVSLELSEIQKILEKKVVDTLTEFSEQRTVNRSVFIRLNPKVNSLCIQKLEVRDKVNVIAIRHKWAYITVMNINDIPVSGWVLKKYLDR